MFHTTAHTMFHKIDTFFSQHSHGWSMGSFGAIAEFTWDPGEPIQCFNDGRVGRVTPRGAIALETHQELTPVAYETIRKNPVHWGQAVAFCLPEALAKRNTKNVLTELGVDDAALRTSDKQQILFDMGLDQKIVDVCIRTDNPTLISRLRNACGKNLLAPDNDIMKHIINAGPTRVFITNIGRAEVYQPIGIDKSPEGPHTHVLPKLLASGRAYSANTPIPNGLLPMLTLHPANPCINKLGKSKVFEETTHLDFQSTLQQWGDENYLSQKNGTWEALAQQVKPCDFDPGKNRHLRSATRIAIRQYQHLHLKNTTTVNEWREAFDKLIAESVS